MSRAAAVGALLLLSGPSAPARTAVCGGRFVVRGAPLLAPGADGSDFVFVDAAGVSIASGCDTVRARLVPGRQGTRVRASWTACDGGRRVRLVGRLSSGCEALRATLSMPGSPAGRRRFRASRRGLEFVQPFAVDYRHDDTHVIVFLDGHPEYEAVEAFVDLRPGKAPLVRAIITRRDKTQSDYINDQTEIDRRLALPLETAREMHLAPVDFAAAGGAVRHVRLAFTSDRGEAIVAEVYPTTPDLPAFGGLTDPVGHAPDVLPVLVRDASGFGAGTSTITIDGMPYPIPPFTPPGLTTPLGVMAFTTTGFEVAVFPTGVATLALEESPRLGLVGERWVYGWSGGESVYEIVARDGDRLQIRKTGDDRERIQARLRRGRVHVERIVLESGSDSAGEIELAFDPYLADPLTAAFGSAVETRFTLSALGSPQITGRVTSDEGALVLRPEDPSWATTRAVRVTATREGTALTLQAAVGG